MGVRRIAVNRQSPGLAESASGSYLTQLNQIAKDDPAVFEILRAQPGEHAHHNAILETLNLLYNGLDEQQAAELTAHLSQYGAIGNNIRNLTNMPGEIHQGGIHPYAKSQGYEYHSRQLNPTGLVRDILDASELPLEYRKHVGGKYMTEAVPAMKDKINDLLTDYYDREPRMAGDALPTLQRLIDSETGAKSIDSVNQEGKNVTINAENVYMEKAVNGNGNAHKKNGQRMPMRRV